MKVLVIGASGLLGSKVFDIMSKRNRMVGTYFSKNPGKHTYLDITHSPGVDAFIEQTKPDVVVHTAAIPSADFCEKNREKAREVNVKGTENIANACKRNRCKMVFISSDYVFDGGNPPYKEDSRTNPVNYYGETKVEGERIVRDLDGHIIIRPAILYGYGNDSQRTWVDSVVNALRRGETVKADNRTVKYPTLIDDVAEAINTLVREDAQGTFHVAGGEAVTRYEWARRIARAMGLPERVEEQEAQGVARPENVLLDTSKIRRLGIEFAGVDDGLRIMRKQAGCMFRMIYSARPDMLLLNQSASSFRIDAGKQLAREAPAEADIVIPVPESGIYAATGYAAQSGLPFFFGIIRDYETRRTLFEPEQVQRDTALRKKLVVVPDVVRGRRVVVVDEAIISGSTLAVVIEKLEEAGAREIHIRIPSPVMASNCINRILERDANLVAKRFRKGENRKEHIEEELARNFGVKSLRFLTKEGFLGVLKSRPEACADCFI